jgi:peptide/nickel transport system permease protein
VSRLVSRLKEKTSIAAMTDVSKPAAEAEVLQDSGAAPQVPWLLLGLNDGTGFRVDLSTVNTCGELMAAVSGHPENRGRVSVSLSKRTPFTLFESQFFWHLKESITFSGRSYATDQGLPEIIGERARFSLALTIPILALEWLIGLVIACLVAYYRDTWIDRLGVFVCVLGMCVPYLAYMLFGQWVMFQIAPEVAVGLAHPLSVYVPVLIATVAGLGGMVRFYRTIILDEINKDYVRTARAKGVPLPSILFTHVLRNCMLPILTSLVTAIPFLIMGALILERFFGIPGLGDLMLSSITSRDVPIITGLTFLSTVLYVLSLLLTDILYAVFDPRIRLT